MQSFCWNKPSYYEDDQTHWKLPWAELIFPYEEEETDVSNAPFLKKNMQMFKENDINFK